jgi:hypothetical protein
VRGGWLLSRAIHRKNAEKWWIEDQMSKFSNGVMAILR